jgi:AraC-like DNA-binding protein
VDSLAVALSAFNRCRELLGEQLNQPVLRWLKELPGVSVSILWQDPLAFQLPGQIFALCPKLRTAWNRGHGAKPPACAACQRQRWWPHLLADSQSRRFQSRCHLSSFCAGVRVGTSWPVVLTVQAGSHGRNFNAAVALLRVIVHDLKTTLAADTARQHAQALETRIWNLETGNSPPQHKALPKGQDVARLGDEPRCVHADQLIKKMLEYLHANYKKPILPSDVAASLKMSANYLSSLFSATMGVSCHRYLENIRFAKAREMLCVPGARIADVSAALGWASSSNFGRAFKERNGVTPGLWRQSGG